MALCALPLLPRGSVKELAHRTRTTEHGPPNCRLYKRKAWSHGHQDTMSSRDTSHVDPKSVPVLGHAFRNMYLIGPKKRKASPANPASGAVPALKQARRGFEVHQLFDAANELGGVINREDWAKLALVHRKMVGRGLAPRAGGDPFRRIRADELMREQRVDALSLRRLPWATMRTEVFADRGDDQFAAVTQCLDAIKDLTEEKTLVLSRQPFLPYDITEHEVHTCYTPLIHQWTERAHIEMATLCRIFMHCCCSVGERPTGNARERDRSTSAERLTRRCQAEAQTDPAVLAARQRVRRRVMGNGDGDMYWRRYRVYWPRFHPYSHLKLARWLNPKVALGLNWFEMRDVQVDALSPDPKVRFNRDLSEVLIRVLVGGRDDEGLMVKCTPQTFMDQALVKMGQDVYEVVQNESARLEDRVNTHPGEMRTWMVHAMDCLRSLLFGANDWHRLLPRVVTTAATDAEAKANTTSFDDIVREHRFGLFHLLQDSIEVDHANPEVLFAPAFALWTRVHFLFPAYGLQVATAHYIFYHRDVLYWQFKNDTNERLSRWVRMVSKLPPTVLALPNTARHHLDWKEYTMGSVPALVVAACVPLAAFQDLVTAWRRAGTPLRVHRVVRGEVTPDKCALFNLSLYEAIDLTKLFWRDMSFWPALHALGDNELWTDIYCASLDRCCTNAANIGAWATENLKPSEAKRSPGAKECATHRLQVLLYEGRNYVLRKWVEEDARPGGYYETELNRLARPVPTLTAYLACVTCFLEGISRRQPTCTTLYDRGLDDDVPFLLACRMPWIHHMRLLMYTLDQLTPGMPAEVTQAVRTLLGAFWTREEINRRVALPAGHLEHLGPIAAAMVMALRLCLERFVRAHPPPLSDPQDLVRIGSDADDDDEDQ